jgi:hypothetical protein
MDGLCLFDRLAVALCEVTVNNKYEMSTSDHPVSNGRIFRPRGNQGGSHHKTHAIDSPQFFLKMGSVSVWL